MAETELRETIKIDGAEQAVSRLDRLAGAAGRVARAFGGVTAVATAIGGIAGVMHIAESVREADRLFQAVSRINAASGVSARHVHAMFNAFESAGLSLEDGERVINSLVTLSGKMSGSVALTGKQVQAMGADFKKLGVDVKDGPHNQLVQMAKAAVDGKLKINDLSQVFGIGRNQAQELMGFLRRGPSAVREAMTSALKSGAIIDTKALESYRAMAKARQELGSSWNDLVLILYKSVIPAVTTILVSIKEKFADIEPIVQRIGAFMARNMETIVSLASTYVKLMLLTKGLNLFSANPKGIGGWAKAAFGAANGAMASRAAGAGTMDYFAAKAAKPGIGMFATVGGPVTRVFSSLAGRLGVIGVVILAVGAAFEMLRKNTWGIATALRNTFGAVASSFGSALQKLGTLFSALFSAIKPVLSILGGALLGALFVISKVLELLAWVIDKIAMAMIGLANGIIWLINKMNKSGVTEAILPGAGALAKNAGALEYLDWAAAKKKGSASTTPDGKPKDHVTNQDFRGSKFEIANNFPQNVDGGRIAVSLGDELARLGERRIDAGVRPLFSYR